MNNNLSNNTSLLKGKNGIIFGIANNRSIAYCIAKVLSANGANLALSYFGEKLEGRASTIASELNCEHLISCDVSDPDSIKSCFESISSKWTKLDFVIHAVAFSKKEELHGRYVDTSLSNFLLTMNVSCYSLALISRYASELMCDGGSIVTLTYYGAEKAVANYNVMGVAKAALESSVRYIALDIGHKNIRVNAISAGPIRTLASSGISGFKEMLDINEKAAPLKRKVNGDDISGTALYLCSDLSSGVTGEIIHVDLGYHAVDGAVQIAYSNAII